MAFSYPVTPDRSGEILGSALANVVGSYYDARDRAHARRMQTLTDAIAEADAASRGITRGRAPTEPSVVPQGEPAAAPASIATPASKFSSDYLGQQQPGLGLASALGADFQKMNAMRAPSPGAYVPGQGFHSPVLDGAHPAATPPAQPSALSAGYLAQRPSTVPATAPAAPAPEPTTGERLAALYRNQPHYKQLTPDFYMDYSAPGVQAQRLQALEGLEKTESDIRLANARAKYFSEHGDYFERGGALGGGSAGRGWTTKVATIGGKRVYARVNQLTGETQGVPDPDKPDEYLAAPEPAGPRPESLSAKANREDKAADRYVAAHRGNIGDPAAFLATPEGKAAAAEGVTPTHLAAAADRYNYKITSVAKSIYDAGMAKSPEDATAKAAQLLGGGGNTAAPPASPPATTVPASNESALTDADLWEKKKHEGLTSEQATAYVRGRKRP